MTFRSYLASFSATWKALTGAALLTAALLKFTPLVPPWPDERGSGASALAIAACVIGIVISYQCGGATARMRGRLAIAAMSVATLLIFAYVYLTAARVASLVQPVQGVEVTRRVVVGTTLRNPADADKTPEQLLELYGLDGSAWTASSLVASRLTLLSVYMGFYMALTFGIGMSQGSARR